MIVSLSIKNFEGINNTIDINFLASNKIKRTRKPFFEVDEKIKILKNVALIGENGSGKSSIVHAIRNMVLFLLYPVSVHRNFDFTESDELDTVKHQIDKYNILGLQNKLSADDNTILKMEVYVSDNGNNIPGIYTYTLIYNKDYKSNGITSEKLTFRNKYSSIKEVELISEENIFESGVASAVIFRNNSNFKKNDNIKYIKSFFDEIFFGAEYFSLTGKINLLKFAEKNLSILKQMSNIADEKIKDVKIDYNNEKPIIEFYIDDKNYLLFNQLSNGSRKAIIFGVKIIEALINNRTLLIDEFEIGLNFTLARFLIMLNESGINSSSQIIFTTHSPLLAFSLDNDQIFYLNNNGFNLETNNVSYLISSGKINKDSDLLKMFTNGRIFNNPDLPDIDNFCLSNKDNFEDYKNDF